MMKRCIALGLCAALLATPASAAEGWTFIWRDKNGQSYIENGSLDRGCTRIQHAAGQRFDWHRPSTGPDSSSCIKMYANETCPGPPQAFSCWNWEKISGGELRAFSVTNTPNASSITIGPAPSATSTPLTTARTPTPMPTASPASAGAIAGAAIGGAVGAALLIGLGVVIVRMCRRRRHANAVAEEAAAATASTGVSPYSSHELTASKTHLAGAAFPMLELPATGRTCAELGAERALAQISGRNETLPAPPAVHTAL